MVLVVVIITIMVMVMVIMVMTHPALERKEDYASKYDHQKHSNNALFQND